jgi:hypothetical protein
VVARRSVANQEVGGRACKPDFVQQAHRRTARLLGDHSSRPRLATSLERPTRGFSISTTCVTLKGVASICMNANSVSWASSPLLFGLAPRGVCRASGITIGAVGSYPTFSPLPAKCALRRRPAGFPAGYHRAALSRRSILCGTFRSAPSGTGFSLCSPWRPLALPGALPFTPYLRSRRGVFLFTSQDGVRTFLPPSHLSMTKPAITRPARQTNYSARTNGIHGDVGASCWHSDSWVWSYGRRSLFRLSSEGDRPISEEHKSEHCPHGNA